MKSTAPNTPATTHNPQPCRRVMKHQPEIGAAIAIAEIRTTQLMFAPKATLGRDLVLLNTFDCTVAFDSGGNISKRPPSIKRTGALG